LEATEDIASEERDEKESEGGGVSRIESKREEALIRCESARDVPLRGGGDDAVAEGSGVSVGGLM
jgi:hypothetical protein